MRSRQGLSSEGSSGRSEPDAGESAEKSARAALLAAMSESDFLDTAINLINDLFLVFDIEGTLLGYNEYAKSLSGYSDEELKMKPLGVLTCPEEEVPKVREAFSLALEGDISKVETWLSCKDGGQVPVEYWLTPLRDREEGIIGVIVVGRDLTERRLAEAALKETEERFRVLIDNSTDITEVIDSENRIEYISPSVQRILGYRPEEMIGKSGFDFNHPDDLPGIIDAVERIVETGIPGSATFRCRHKDGSWHLCEGLASLLPGPPGERRLVVNIRDITERAAMEEKLRVTQFEVDNALDLVMRVAPDGRVLYVNDTACRVFGCSSDEMLEGFIWDFNPGVKEPEWPSIWDNRADFFPSRREIEIPSGDGSSASFELVLETLGLEYEEHLVILGRDITRRKATEEQLSQANRELAIYARTVTHDIMAPLSAISIVSEGLDRLFESGDSDKDNLMAREMVDTIRSGVADAIGLATDIVSLSQVRAPDGVVDRVDVRRVVNRVVEQLAPEITSRGVDLKFDETLGEILASPTHIYQLFLNLISNAVKYNNNRNPVVTVSRLQSPAEDAHRYLVSDNGPGIDPENIDLMFQPFFKGESGGTGLGLATVMKVVKLYAGTVAVYNDGGACFEFTLYDARRDVENG